MARPQCDTPLVIDVFFLNAIYHTHKMKSGDNHGPPFCLWYGQKALDKVVCMFVILQFFRLMEQKLMNLD
jgi:hypothetical protein